MSVGWNPWHGCHRVSEGCQNCYVYRIDGAHGKESSSISLNNDFLLPLRERNGIPKIESGETVYTCFSSDFLIAEADEWRADAWRMMRLRSDLHFVFFTKRIERLANLLPNDWGDGYENVTVGCTCENQARADQRLPVFLSLPLRRRIIVCEPLLTSIDLRPYLDRNKIHEVSVGGESGDGARVCDFDWVTDIYRACEAAGIRFTYHQTGARLLKNGKEYHIPRRHQHEQAGRAFAEWEKSRESFNFSQQKD
jgi:protein gp37